MTSSQTYVTYSGFTESYLSYGDRNDITTTMAWSI